jgi:ribosomal protein S6E (S10)
MTFSASTTLFMARSSSHSHPKTKTHKKRPPWAGGQMEEAEIDALFEQVSVHSDLQVAVSLLRQGATRKASELLGELAHDSDARVAREALLWLAQARADMGDLPAAVAALEQRGGDDERGRRMRQRLEARQRRDVLLGAAVLGVGVLVALGCLALLFRRGGK